MSIRGSEGNKSIIDPHITRLQFCWADISVPSVFQASLFNQVDHARDAYFHDRPMRGVQTPLWVIRSSTLKLLHDDLPKAGQYVEITSRVVRLGKTSMIFEHDIIWERKDAFTERVERIPLAWAVGVCIYIGNFQKGDHERPQPRQLPRNHGIQVAPESDLFRQWMTTSRQSLPSSPGKSAIYLNIPASESQSQDAESVASDLIVPAATQVFRRYINIRHSDRDGLDHLTNARYPNYFHDTLSYASEKGVIQHMSADIYETQVSFDNEIKEGYVEICMWFVPTTTPLSQDLTEPGTYYFVMIKESGDIAARAAMRVWGEANKRRRRHRPRRTRSRL